MFNLWTTDSNYLQNIHWNKYENLSSNWIPFILFLLQAIEYAKTVPKPKAAAPKVFDKPKESKQDNHENSDRYRFHSNDQITKEEFLLGDLDNIRWLKERHDQERQKIAKLLPREL